MASRLVLPEEIDEGDDVGELIEEAAEMYGELCADSTVRDLYLSGIVMHEVPFTMREGGRVLRGTVDCLIRAAIDRVIVLEFKTGRERPEHAAQVGLYRGAVERIFPGCVVLTRVIHVGGRSGA